MKKTFAALLISASLVACGKKESTTPKEQPVEQKDDATGGARYGGHKDAPKDATAPKDSNPASPK